MDDGCFGGGGSGIFGIRERAGGGDGAIPLGVAPMSESAAPSGAANSSGYFGAVAATWRCVLDKWC